MTQYLVTAGRLDRRVTVQRKILTQAPSGHPTERWHDVAQRLWASRVPVRGDERSTASQWVAKEQVEFRIRYMPAVAELSPLDRVICPAPNEANAQHPPAAQTYDIIAVHEIGRRRGLKIIAARNADVLTVPPTSGGSS